MSMPEVDVTSQRSTLALVIHNLGTGGAQRVLTTLANSWADSGRSVCVISIDGSEDDFFQLAGNVRHVVLDVRGPTISLFKLNGLYMTVKRVLAIRKAIKNTSPDVVIAFLGVNNILTILAATGMNVRVVISERNDPAREKLGFGWDFLRKVLYRRASLVSANTRGALQTMRAYVPADKLVFVPNPMPCVDRESATGKTDKMLLAVGDLRHQKAHDLLLRACAGVFRTRPDWRLVIVGDGPLWGALHELADSLGISASIIWTGRAEPDEFYRRAQIFLLPSRYEGTPNALLEAMNHGLPAIVTDASPGPLEYIDHDKSGLVVPVDDAHALSNAILRLIGDERLRQELGAAAAQRLKGNRLEQALKGWERAIGIV